MVNFTRETRTISDFNQAEELTRSCQTPGQSSALWPGASGENAKSGIAMTGRSSFLAPYSLIRCPCANLFDLRGLRLEAGFQFGQISF